MNEGFKSLAAKRSFMPGQAVMVYGGLRLSQDEADARQELYRSRGDENFYQANVRIDQAFLFLFSLINSNFLKLVGVLSKAAGCPARYFPANIYH